MIVQESDLLLQALDQRLEIDRVLAVDPVKAVASSNEERSPPTSTPGSNASMAANATASVESAFLARLPLGRIVPATIIEIAGADHVIADVEQWRVALAWPSGANLAPRPGQQIALRVLAHQPMLLFQSVDASGEAIEADGRSADVPTRWSPNALELSRQSVAADTRGVSEVEHFTEPIVQIRMMSSDRMTLGDRIALDDVIVGHSTGTSASSTPRPATDAARTSSMLPVVLQGPAWPGQPVEMVVRREQADEALDNAALDAWCGDITIDLPTLGRVSGRLSFSMQGLRIRLDGDDANTVASMHEASAILAAAFADADLRVQSLSIGTGRGIDVSRMENDPASTFRVRG